MQNSKNRTVNELIYLQCFGNSNLCVYKLECQKLKIARKMCTEYLEYILSEMNYLYTFIVNYIVFIIKCLVQNR